MPYENRTRADTFDSEKTETVWVVISAAVWCMLASMSVIDKCVCVCKKKSAHTKFKTWTSISLSADYYSKIFKNEQIDM